MTEEESLHLHYYRKTIMQMWKAVLIGVILAVVTSVSMARLIAYRDVKDLKQYIDESVGKIERTLK